jgi:hypothetical protein
MVRHSTDPSSLLFLIYIGLELAKLAGLPMDVMAKATEVAIKLSDLEEKGGFHVADDSPVLISATRPQTERHGSVSN